MSYSEYRYKLAENLESELTYRYPFKVRVSNRSMYDVDIIEEDTDVTLFTLRIDNDAVDENVRTVEEHLGKLLEKMLNVHNTTKEVVQFRKAICGTSKNWTETLLNEERMSKFFDVRIQLDGPKKHAIVNLSCKGWLVYFGHTAYLRKSSGAHRLCDAQTYGIQVMLNPSRPEIEIGGHNSEGTKIELDHTQHRVNLAVTNHSKWAYTEVLKHEGKVYHARHYVVTSLGYSDMAYTATEYLVTKVNNKLDCVETELPVPDWLYSIRDRMSRCKNPHNVPAHPYLGDTDPLYIDHEYYVTSDKDVYVKHLGAWLPVNGGMKYLRKMEDLLGDGVSQWLKRYDLAISLQQ